MPAIASRIFIERQHDAHSRRLSVVLGILLAAGSWANGQDLPPNAPPDHAPDARVSVRADEVVTAELIPGVDAIVPGEPFFVGVRLLIAEPWHIYWKYPGDAGVATKIRLVLPDGFDAAEPNFPVPIQFTQPGDILGYGYEREAVFMIRVTPPADLAVGSSVPVKADISFLRCVDVCVPGKASLELALPVADRSHLNTWLDSFRARMPVAHRQDLHPLTVSPTADGGRWLVRARFQTPAIAESAKWFPAPPRGFVINDLKHWTEADTAVLSFTTGGKVPQPAELPVLVVYTDQAGRTVSVEQIARQGP